MINALMFLNQNSLLNHFSDEISLCIFVISVNIYLHIYKLNNVNWISASHDTLITDCPSVEMSHHSLLSNRKCSPYVSIWFHFDYLLMLLF